MGYTTEFFGRFNLDRPLQRNHLAYLKQFSQSRRIKRCAERAEAIAATHDQLRVAAGLPIGYDGEFYVGLDSDDGAVFLAQNESIVDNNTPPSNQPSLWCGWTPSADGSAATTSAKPPVLTSGKTSAATCKTFIQRRPSDQLAQHVTRHQGDPRFGA